MLAVMNIALTAAAFIAAATAYAYNRRVERSLAATQECNREIREHLAHIEERVAVLRGLRAPRRAEGDT